MEAASCVARRNRTTAIDGSWPNTSKKNGVASRSSIFCESGKGLKCLRQLTRAPTVIPALACRHRPTSKIVNGETQIHGGEDPMHVLPRRNGVGQTDHVLRFPFSELDRKS